MKVDEGEAGTCPPGGAIRQHRRGLGVSELGMMSTQAVQVCVSMLVNPIRHSDCPGKAEVNVVQVLPPLNRAPQSTFCASVECAG